jgi:hypothetical protein
MTVRTSENFEANLGPDEYFRARPIGVYHYESPKAGSSAIISFGSRFSYVVDSLIVNLSISHIAYHNLPRYPRLQRDMRLCLCGIHLSLVLQKMKA